MAQNYVVRGAKIKCTMGTVEASLWIKPSRKVKAHGKAKANIMDCAPINVGPFGVCKTTHMPCIPACTGWLNGKTDVLVERFPALLTNSVAICATGAGILKIKNDGQ